MNIAIKGHETRGAEVIEILKMLGGTNPHNYSADSDIFCFYIGKGINDINVIYYDWIHGCYDDEEWIVFTLEEFEKKFPYKVGDKVYNIIHNENQTITDLAWDSKENEVVYQTNNNEYVFVNYLQPYKKETVEEEGVYADNEINCYHQDFGDKVRIRLGGDYEIKVEDRVTYIVKKQPQYPKTYKECCEVLKIPKNERYIDVPLVPSNYNKLVSTFTKLLICRDAYWKIAGVEMGLGKPWKPDYHEKSYEQGSPIKYVIYYTGTYITKEQKCTPSYILAFPTAEIRDTFFKNFKELIEIVKELL